MKIRGVYDLGQVRMMSIRKARLGKDIGWETFSEESPSPPLDVDRGGGGRDQDLHYRVAKTRKAR